MQILLEAALLSFKSSSAEELMDIAHCHSLVLRVPFEIRVNT